MSKTPGFTPRDIRLMIGFGFFLELVVGYMLLIDGPLTQAHKLRQQLAKSQEAHAALQEAVTAERSSGSEALPPILALKPGENSSLAIQSYLEKLTTRHAVTPVGTSILSQEESTCRVEVELQGSYEAIGELVAELERPEVLMGLDRMALKTDPQDPDRIVANLTLTFFYKASDG